MNAIMVRAKIKEENVADAQAVTDGLASPIVAAQLAEALRDEQT